MLENVNMNVGDSNLTINVVDSIVEYVREFRNGVGITLFPVVLYLYM